MTTAEHISEDLPRLLTGDATRAEVSAASKHLRSCPDCQQELVSAVVAHASLASARRYAPDIVATKAADGDAAPADRLPDMSSVFAQAREQAAASATSRFTRRRVLAVAAAAAVVVGAGVIAVETVDWGSSTHVAAQTVRLQPVIAGHAAATATISDGRMRVDATSLPQLDAARQYEVWLTNGTGSSLRPIGYIGADRTAELPVPAAVMAGYGYIAISVQKTDQIAFSGDLVARGQFA